MVVHFSETLKNSDPIEMWVEKFILSTDPRFDHMNKNERTEQALESYYESQSLNDEAPLIAPKNADIRPRLTIVRSVDTEARRGSVSLMGNGNVLEKNANKAKLKKNRAIAITKLSLPKELDESLIEAYIDDMISKNQKEFPSSIQVIIDTFEEFNKEQSK